MKHLRLMAIALISTLLFTACKKDNKEEGPKETGLSYQISFSGGTAGSAGTNTVPEIKTSVITWTSGYVNVSDVVFEVTKDGQKAELASTINQRFDIFKLVSDIVNVDVPQGTYQNILFKTRIASTSSHHAFELKGKYTSNGVTTPIVVRVTQPLTFQVEHKEPITINNGDLFYALNKVNLSALTADITEEMLNNAVRNNGTIVITNYMNSNMYFMIGDILNKFLNIEIKKG